MLASLASDASGLDTPASHSSNAHGQVAPAAAHISSYSDDFAHLGVPVRVPGPSSCTCRRRAGSDIVRTTYRKHLGRRGGIRTVVRL